MTVPATNLMGRKTVAMTRQRFTPSSHEDAQPYLRVLFRAPSSAVSTGRRPSRTPKAHPAPLRAVVAAAVAEFARPGAPAALPDCGCEVTAPGHGHPGRHQRPRPLDGLVGHGGSVTTTTTADSERESRSRFLARLKAPSNVPSR
jgi:hypothetical protein